MLLAIRALAYLSILAGSYFYGFHNALPTMAKEINIGVNDTILMGDISNINPTPPPRQSLSIPQRGEIPSTQNNNKFLDPSLFLQILPSMGLTPVLNNNANGIYVPIGTPSRVFPGLTGFQEIHNKTPYSFSEYKRIAD